MEVINLLDGSQLFKNWLKKHTLYTVLLPHFHSSDKQVTAGYYDLFSACVNSALYEISAEFKVCPRR